MKIPKSLEVVEQIILRLTRPLTKNFEVNKSELQLNPSNSTIDQKKLYDISERNGVASLLYARNSKLDLVPGALAQEFRDVYYKTALRNLKLLHETLLVLDLLANNNIRVIPLKGAIASEVIFENLGVYPSGDIDILVHPSQLKAACDILCEKGGYIKVEEIKEEDLLLNHYHLLLKKDSHLLEVHWNLVKRYFSIPPDFWWSDITETSSHNIIVSELAIEKYILYLIFRLFDHGFYPLKFFVILATLIEKKRNEIKWENLLDYAAQFKMERLLFIALQLLHDCFGITIPRRVLDKKIHGYCYFKRIILSDIFHDRKRPHIKMMIYTLMLDSKIRILKILFGRLFPSKGEIRLRYRLEPHSIKVYYYYLLNPFLLFKK